LCSTKVVENNWKFFLLSNYANVLMEGVLAVNIPVK
jgi:hypothetical protein